QPASFLPFRADPPFDLVPPDAAAANTREELPDRVDVVAHVRLLVRKAQQEPGPVVREVGVLVGDHHRQAVAEVLAYLQRTRLVHVLAMQRERADGDVGAREQRLVRVASERWM